MSSDDPFTGWGWREVEAALLGSGDSSGPSGRSATTAVAGQPPEPQTLYAAARTLLFVQQTLGAIGDSLTSANTTLTGGADAPWQGAAANAFATTMTSFAHQVGNAEQVLAGGPDGVNSVPESLDRSGDALTSAMEAVSTLNGRFGQAAAINGPAGTDAAAVLNPVTGQPGTVGDWLTAQELPILIKLSSDYQFVIDSLPSAPPVDTTVQTATPFVNPFPPDPNPFVDQAANNGGMEGSVTGGGPAVATKQSSPSAAVPGTDASSVPGVALEVDNDLGRVENSVIGSHETLFAQPLTKSAGVNDFAENSPGERLMVPGVVDTPTAGVGPGLPGGPPASPAGGPSIFVRSIGPLDRPTITVPVGIPFGNNGPDPGIGDEPLPVSEVPLLDNEFSAVSGGIGVRVRSAPGLPDIEELDEPSIGTSLIRGPGPGEADLDEAGLPGRVGRVRLSDLETSAPRLPGEPDLVAEAGSVAEEGLVSPTMPGQEMPMPPGGGAAAGFDDDEPSDASGLLGAEAFPGDDVDDAVFDERHGVSSAVSAALDEETGWGAADAGALAWLCDEPSEKRKKGARR